MASEIGRFPRLFRGKESIPGLTWPYLTFHNRMTLWMGGREVQIIHIGRSHTAGDTVVWLPEEKVLFAGDTVEFGATPYCGDAHFADWPTTLAAIKALGAERVVPGRGRSLIGAAEVDESDSRHVGLRQRPVRHRPRRRGEGRRARAGLRRGDDGDAARNTGTG